MSNKKPQSRSRARRILRRILLAATGLLVLLVLGVAAAWGIMQTPWAKGRLAAYLEERIGRELEQEVELTGLSGMLPWQIRLARLRLGAENAPWLTVRDLAIAPRLRPLLSGRLHLDSLSVAEADFDHLPELPEREEAESSGFELPNLRIDSIQIERLRLGAAVAGAELVVRAQGQLDPEAEEEFAGLLTIEAPGSDAGGSLRIGLSESRLKPIFDLRVEWDEAEPIFSGLAGMPELAPLGVRATVNGPLDAMAIEATVKIADQNAVSFTGMATWQDATLALTLAGEVQPEPWSLPEAVRSRWQAPLRADVKLRLKAEGPWELEQGLFQLPGARLELKGDWDPARKEGAMQAAVRLDELQAWRIPGAEQLRGTLDAEVTLSGADSLLEMELAARSKELALGEEWVLKEPSAKVTVRELRVPLPEWPKVPGATFEVRANAAAMELPGARTVRGLSLALDGSGEEDRLTVSRIAILTDAAMLAGEGSVAPQAGELSLDLVGEVKDLESVSALIGKELGGRFTFDVEADLTLDGYAGDFVLAALWEEPHVVGWSAQSLLSTQLELGVKGSRGADGGLVIDRLLVIAGEKRLEVAGTARPAEEEADLSFTVSWPRLAELQSLLPIEIGGSWDGTGTVHISPEAVDAEVSWEAKEITVESYAASHLTGNWRVQAPEPFSGKHPRLALVAEGELAGLALGHELPADAFGYDVQAEWPSPDEVRISRLKLDAEGLQAGVTGNLAPEAGEMDLAVSVALAELGQLQPLLPMEVAGSLDLEGKVTGSFTAPRLAVTSNARELKIGTFITSAATVTISAEPDGEAWQGKLDLALDAAGENLRLQSDWSASEASLALADLRLSGPETAIAGDLRLTLETMALEGDLSGTIASFGPAARLLRQPISGSAEVTMAFRHKQAQQAAVVELRLRDLASPWLDAATLHVQADIQNLREEPGGTVQVKGGDLEGYGVNLSELEASVSGGLAAFDYSLATSGDWERRSFTVASTGSAALPLELALRSLSGMIDSTPFTLLVPATISMEGESYRLTQTEMKIGPGRLSGGGTFAPEGMELAVTLDALPFGDLLPKRFNLVSGTLSGEANATGSPDAPTLSLILKVAELRMVSSAEQAVFTGNGNLQLAFADGGLTAELRMDGEGGESLRGQATMPLELRLLPFAWSLPSQGEIDGTLAMDIALEPSLMPLLPEGHAVAGSFIGRLTIQGHFPNPTLEGSLRIRDGRYENYFTGTALQDLSLVLEGRNRELVVQELQANDGIDGTISGSGSWRADSAKGAPLNFDLEVKDFAVLRQPEMYVNANGKLQLSGGMESLELKGAMEVGPAEVRLVDRRRQIPEIEITETRHGVPIAPPETPASTTERKPSPLPELHLDITARSPARVFVRGRGLNSEWEGEVQVAGTAIEPRLSGELRIVRGTYSLAGRRLNLVEGTLRFTGANPIAPVIHLVAEARVAEVTIRLVFSGSAISPTLDVQSDPAMPEDEALSHLLFRRGTGQITPYQALTLARLADNLRTGGNGFDIADKLRQLTGFDQIELTPGEEEGAEGPGHLQVGKYIGDRVYLEYGKGLGEAEDRVSIEVELTPNISVESSAGGGGTTGAGLNWKYDY